MCLISRMSNWTNAGKEDLEISPNVRKMSDTCFKIDMEAKI